MKAQTVKTVVFPVLFFFAVLVVWELAVYFFGIPEYLLPRPLNVLYEIFNRFGFFLKHSSITAIEAGVGFLIGNLLGFLVAVVFVYSKTLEKALYPYAIALKTTPILAMAPLLVLWFGTGLSSKVVAAAMVCFFPILVNTIKGLNSIDSDHLSLFRSFSAEKYQLFFKLRLPHALPYIFSALKISTSLSFVGAIVGEFVGAKAGLGFIILTSTYHLETVTMFAAILFSALVGVLFFYFVGFLERKIIFWYKSEISLS